MKAQFIGRALVDDSTTLQETFVKNGGKIIKSRSKIPNFYVLSANTIPYSHCKIGATAWKALEKVMFCFC